MNSQQQFIELNSLWEKIQAEQTLHHWHYQCAGIFFSISSPHIMLTKNLVKALSHLLVAQAPQVHFKIRVLDTSQIRYKLPLLNWDQLVARGYRGYKDGNIYFHYFQYIGVLSCIDVEAGEAYYIVRDHAKLPWWVAGSPFIIILHQAFSRHHMQVTHTAAVANQSSAVLLTGKGGSGKSTTTLVCAKAGLSIIGEDYCVLDAASPAQIHSLYQSAKWTPQTVQFFSEYASFITNKTRTEIEKSLVYYQDFLSKPMCLSASIRAVISLQVNATGETILESQEQQEGMQHLMMSTLAQLPGSGPQTLRFFQEFSSKHSFLRLTLGKKHEENIAAIKGILE